MTSQIEISSTGDQLEMVINKMQNPIKINSTKKTDVKIWLWSGRKCTCSGEWEVEGKISTIAYLSKGDLMPEYCGKKVKWILLCKG